MITLDDLLLRIRIAYDQSQRMTLLGREQRFHTDFDQGRLAVLAQIEQAIVSGDITALKVADEPQR